MIGSGDSDTMGLDDASVTFDDLLEHAGQTGKFQIATFVILSFFSFWGVEGLMMPFIGGEMPHWCLVPELTSLSEEQQRYITSPVDAVDGNNLSTCTMYNLNYSAYTRDDFIYWNRSSMVTEDTTVQPCDKGWNYGTGGTFTSTVVNRYDLVCGRSYLVEVASSVLMFGILIGAGTSGAASDRFGRKKTLLAFLLFKIVGLFLSTYSPNYIGFAVARFIVGVGTSGCYITAYVICIEMVGADHRSRCGVLFNALFSVGLLALPIMSYFIPNERTLQLGIAVPNVVFLLPWLFLSESPRWLIVRGRYEEAFTVLRFIARINGREFPDDVTYDGSNEALTHEEGGTICDLFRTPVIRRTTLTVALHWFVDSLLYYGLTLNTANLSGNIFINSILMSLVEFPANVACLGLLNWKRTGRRFTCSVSHVAAAASSFLTIPFILQGGEYSVTVLSIVGKAFVTIGFTGIYVYSAEVFPTEVRNIGIGTASMCARFSGMAAPFVGKPIANLWKPLPAAICGFSACVSGGLTLLLPETRKSPLMETVQDVERSKFGTNTRHLQTSPQFSTNRADTAHQPRADDTPDDRMSTGTGPMVNFAAGLTEANAGVENWIAAIDTTNESHAVSSNIR